MPSIVYTFLGNGGEVYISLARSTHQTMLAGADGYYPGRVEAGDEEEDGIGSVEPK